MSDIQHFAKFFEALPTISPSIVIAKGWTEHLQNFFRNGTEDEYSRFKPDCFARDPPAAPNTASQHPHALVARKRPLVEPSDTVPLPGAPTASQRHSLDRLAIIEWTPPETPLKRPRSISSPLKQVKLVKDAVKSIPDHNTPIFSGSNAIFRSHTSSPYTNLGHGIKRLTQLDCLHVLLVSHVVDDQERRLRKSTEHYTNYRSEAITLAARVLDVEHEKVSSMLKVANKYLILLGYGPALVFAIGDGSRNLWGKKMNFEEIHRAGEMVGRKRSKEENFMASAAILDALSRYGFSYSDIVETESRLVVTVQTWVDVQEFRRGRFKMCDEERWVDVQEVQGRLDFQEKRLQTEGTGTCNNSLHQGMDTAPRPGALSSENAGTTDFQLITSPFEMQADIRRSSQFSSRDYASQLNARHQPAGYPPQQSFTGLFDIIPDSNQSAYPTISTWNDKGGCQLQSMTQPQQGVPMAHDTQEADLEAIVATLYDPCWTDTANIDPREDT